MDAYVALGDDRSGFRGDVHPELHLDLFRAGLPRGAPPDNTGIRSHIHRLRGFTALDEVWTVGM